MCCLTSSCLLTDWKNLLADFGPLCIKREVGVPAVLTNCLGLNSLQPTLWSQMLVCCLLSWVAVRENQHVLISPEYLRQWTKVSIATNSQRDLCREQLLISLSKMGALVRLCIVSIARCRKTYLSCVMSSTLVYIPQRVYSLVHDARSVVYIEIEFWELGMQAYESDSAFSEILN